MKVIIIYESFFGNTQKVAQASFDALAARCEVQILHIDEFKTELLKNCDLLIAGSPTRAFRPTPGIISCLKTIPDSVLTGIYVATFDTRISENSVNSFVRMMMKWFGYAAKPLSNLLHRKGGLLLTNPEGFIVNGTEGPLADQELTRVKSWAIHLIELLSEKRKL
ncbi:MAG: hypothetical protein RL220_997 [Bacteroidota bacterium]|jgi:flavodoxin